MTEIITIICGILISEEAAELFLGKQGHAWDIQSANAIAPRGTMLALATSSRLYDRQLIALDANRH